MTNHPNRSKKAKYREGQEVEVLNLVYEYDCHAWRKATIVHQYEDGYVVQFTTGPTEWFDTDHIRLARI